MFMRRVEIFKIANKKNWRCFSSSFFLFLFLV